MEVLEFRVPSRPALKSIGCQYDRQRYVFGLGISVGSLVWWWLIWLLLLQRLLCRVESIYVSVRIDMLDSVMMFCLLLFGAGGWFIRQWRCWVELLHFSLSRVWWLSRVGLGYIVSEWGMVFMWMICCIGDVCIRCDEQVWVRWCGGDWFGCCCCRGCFVVFGWGKRIIWNGRLFYL